MLRGLGMRGCRLVKPCDGIAFLTLRKFTQIFELRQATLGEVAEGQASYQKQVQAIPELMEQDGHRPRQNFVYKTT